MDVLRSALAFFIGALLLYVFYSFIALPVLPCAAVYAVAWMAMPDSGGPLFPSLILTAVFAAAGFALYAISGIVSVVHDPAGVFSIVSDFLTAAAFIGAGLFYCRALAAEIKARGGEKPDNEEENGE